MRQKLEGPFAWTGPELARSSAWIRDWSAAEIDEIERAITQARGAGRPATETTRDDFPMPRVAAALEAAARELEDGRGIMLLRGLPVERWDETARRLAIWGIGAHLGTAVSQ